MLYKNNVNEKMYTVMYIASEKAFVKEQICLRNVPYVLLTHIIAKLARPKTHTLQLHSVQILHLPYGKNDV